MTDKAPKIYNYSSVTGEFIGESTADQDPLEQGNWLVPANACMDSPPSAKKGYAIVRSESGWTHIEDRRGAVYSTETGAPAELQDLGPIPEGFTEKAPPGPFHSWNGKSWRLNKDAELAGATDDAQSIRRQRLAEASVMIAPLQDAVDLQDATESEMKMLTDLKRYRVALNRIELQEGFPKNIAWPQLPE